MATNNSKRYKCPYCEYRNYRKDLINHVEDNHEDMIPKGYTSSRVVYNTINKKDHGTCMICHKETKWDENKQRYDTLCGNPKCKKQYVEIVRSRMVHKYGTYNLLKDPNFQKKMLQNRSISGKYKFEDGGSVGYVGSYEKKFLEFMDKFLHIKSYDIISPGPNIPYTYKGEEHVWITDFLYEPYNLVFDIKDGGDNPNTRDMKEYREKQLAKEKAIAEYGDYNYIRLTDNKFEQLILLMMELKEKDDEKPIIRINESHIISSNEDDNMIHENLILNKKDLEINVDKFESGAKNVLLVTGFSGSGKSTLASELADKYKCINYELDCLDFYLHKYLTAENMIGSEDGLYEFVKRKKLKFGDKSKSGTELYREYVKFLINWCKSQKDKKFIIEGLQIYEIFEDGDTFITSCPIIIRGTSGLVSAIRAAKRNDGSFLKEFGPLVKWALKDNKSLNKLIKSLNESYTNEFVSNKVIDDFESKEDMYISKFTKIGINSSFIKVYKKEYPTLSHIRINNNTKGCVWVDNEKKLVAMINTERKDDDYVWINAFEIFGKYKGHGLSKQILRYAIKEYRITHLSVNKNNEIAYNLYKKLGFKTYKTTESMYFMCIKSLNESFIEEETRIDDDKVPENIYHISTVNHDGETFEPRYYDNDNIKKDMERRVKRVCFSDSINGAFYSIFPNGAYDIDLFVHVPGHKVKVYETTSDDIYDSDITHELWVKEPVEMKCIGKIHISGISGKYHILEVDKDKSGYAKRKYYEPRWNWVEKYDKESIKEDGNNPSVSAVYFTKEITPKSLQKIYHAMNHELHGNIAIKISTGELGGHNFLSSNLIKDLVKELNGTIVECNTAYEGHRNTSADHWDTIKKHRFLNVAKVDIMDEEGDMILPIVDGYHLNENYVGYHIRKYDSVLMLSHFKGHTMAGYGGALKNMSIGMASSRGKLHIHTAGKGGDMMKADRNKFLESMVDADQSIMNYFGRDNILYINVANNLSIDCDCDSHPKDPEISDIGIFASTDPVALDQACIDAVYNHPDPKKRSLINRIESRNGTHTIDCAYNHNLGNKDYTIIDIDESDITENI